MVVAVLHDRSKLSAVSIQYVCCLRCVRVFRNTLHFLGGVRRIGHSLVVVQLVVAVEVVVVVVAVLVVSKYYLSPAHSAGQEGPGVLMEEAGEDCGAG